MPRGIAKAPVFARPDGNPYTKIEVQRAFRVLRSLSGIRSTLTVHSLRHTTASWLAIQGRPLREIQLVLGHANISQSVKYSHLQPEHLQPFVAALETAMANVEMEEGHAERG
jgi:site-specific recombinase XerD